MDKALHHIMTFNTRVGPQTEAQLSAHTQQQQVDKIQQHLSLCPSEINPAIKLYWELMQKQSAGMLALEELLLRQSEIQQCQQEGQQQLDTVSGIQKQLRWASPQPCNPLLVMV
jgi:hypothetical protein